MSVNLGKEVFKNIWHWQDFNSALMVQTSSHHAIIRPWNQHWNLLRHQRRSLHMSQSGLVNKKLNYCRETARRALSNCPVSNCVTVPNFVAWVPKSGYKYKNWLQFTHSPISPPWTNIYLIWHSCRGRRHSPEVKRSRSHGYKNHHGRTVASDACCYGRVLLLPACSGWLCPWFCHCHPFHLRSCFIAN